MEDGSLLSLQMDTRALVHVWRYSYRFMGSSMLKKYSILLFSVLKKTFNLNAFCLKQGYNRRVLAVQRQPNFL